MTLYEHLSGFYRHSSVDELTKTFTGLAKCFIYGGYIQVGGDYRVYIRSVEFYYHDETDAPDAVKDPIMYHRNYRRQRSVEVPYFPLMTLNAHESGYDITFENETEKYRASALICEYSIYDIKKHEFLILKNGKMRDDRVTYLYDYLNGFSLNGQPAVVWVDDAHEQSTKLRQDKRVRTFVMKDGKKTNEHDGRMWRFTLNEEIWLPTD